MTTVAEFYQRVGEDLALVPIGQALDSQDNTRIAAAYSEVYARIKQKGLATWALSGELPSLVVPYVALMVEEKLLTSYSVPDQRYQRIKSDAGTDSMTALAGLAMAVTPQYESVENDVGY